MKKFTIALLLALTALALTAAPAHSQNPCRNYRSFAMMLLGQYEELPVMVLEQENGSRLETWLNRETGTWTSVLVRKDGCVEGARSGTNFTIVIVEPEPEGVSL